MVNYYVGVNIKNIMGKKVEVLNQIGVCGTKQDIPVYKCVGEDGEIYKIVGSNLSEFPIEYKNAYGGMGDCFPKDVKRFSSFKNGRYIGDWESVGV